MVELAATVDSVIFLPSYLCSMKTYHTLVDDWCLILSVILALVRALNHNEEAFHWRVTPLGSAGPNLYTLWGAICAFQAIICPVVHYGICDIFIIQIFTCYGEGK